MKGQAVLEALAASLAILAAAVAILVTMKIAFTRIYLDHLAHEALICKTSAKLEQSVGELNSECEMQLKAKANDFMSSIQVVNVKWHRGADYVGLTLTFNLNSHGEKGPLNWNFKNFTYSKFLKLPLELDSPAFL